MAEKVDIKLYSWVLRGSQRVEIVKALSEPKTPTQLHRETKIKFSNISDNLKLMLKRKLVICLTPKEKTGRLYQLTRKGRAIREMLIRD